MRLDGPRSVRAKLAFHLTLFALAVFLSSTDAARGASFVVSVDRDAWLKESAQNENHGADKELSSKNKPGDGFRVIARFDVSAVPADSTVTSAMAWFYLSGEDDSGDPVNVHRVTKNWAETLVTWNNAGSDFDPATVHGSFIASPQGWVSVDLASLVQNWVCGEFSNHGIMLLSTSTDTESKYASKEWDVSSERPWMDVVTSGTGGCSGSGDVYYVRTSGDDANSGLSPAQAWRTIGEAADTMVAGDVVYVGAGTYDEDVKAENSGTAASPIRYLADTTGAATGDAGPVVITRLDKDVVTIDGVNHIQLVGFRVTGGKKGIKVKDATGILLQDCEIDDQSDRGLEVDSSDVDITGCDIHDNGKIGLLAKKGAALTIFETLVRQNGDEGVVVKGAASSLSISRCDIDGNGKRGVEIDKGSVEIVNCVVSGNARDGIGLKKDQASLTLWHSTVVGNDIDGIAQDKGSSTITNSIVVSNGSYGLDLGNGTMTHTYNLLFGNTAGDYDGASAASGEISQDPSFVGGGDYHLLAGSPAIDAGTDGSSATSVDRDGSSRPTGGGWEMGAYEFPSDAVDHFLINHDGNGVHCLAETISVTATDSGGNPVTNYTGTVTLDTQSGSGTWFDGAGNAGSFSDPTANDGLASYQFAGADGGVASFTLNYSGGATPIDVDVYETAIPSVRDDDSEGTFAWAPSGFTVTASAVGNPPPNPIDDPIATQTAGEPFTLHLAAYGTTPTDPTCGVIESYSGSKNLKFWSAYSDPSSGTVLVSIDGSAIASSEGAASAQAVSFSSGQASVGAKYKDVGRIRIRMKDDTVAEPAGGITGATTLFVVRPADFAILSVERPDSSPNPGASTPSGAIFVAAGSAFRVSIEVRDSEGARTPNYGNESAPEGLLLTASTLVAPAGGRNGSNDDGAIGNGSSFAATIPAGSFSGASFSWDEVGAIRLRVGVADADYLSAGDVLGTESADVGRFTPNDLDVAVDTAPVFATGCASGGFSYQGQPFGYGQAPVLLVTARSAGGTTTRNYSGSWWQITNASLGDPTYASDPGAPATLDTSGLPNPSGDPMILDLGNGTGTLSFDSGTGLRFDRGVAVAPFDAELSLGIDVVDGDTVAHAANPFQLGSATPGGGIAFSSGKAMRYGRLTLGNAHDSERVTLAVPLRAEYYDGSGFRLHTDDSCTGIGTANFGTTDRSPIGLMTTPAIANLPLAGGDAGLTLSAPGQAGYADLLVNLSDVDVSTPWGTITGADLRWLRFDWTTDGTGLPDDDPTSRATFGIYSGQHPVIFRREIY